MAIPIVPWPYSLTQFPGSTAVGSRPSISYSAPLLRPLAIEFAREIGVVTGVSPVVGGTGKGSIVLRLDSRQEGESFQIDTRSQVEVRAGNYAAMAMATSELVQCASRSKSGVVAFPRLLVKDKPLFPYRGLMIDVARKPHPVAELKKAVMLCHLYRVRYLQLHLTDDQGWTFPSSKFPNLGSKNESYQGAGPSPVYSRNDLKGLVDYADLLGVTIVPEIDTPGHTAAMRRTQPEPFSTEATGGVAGDGILDVLKPAAVDGVKSILGEAGALFPSSPYVHIGGDEAEINQLRKDPSYDERIAEGGFKEPWDLFLQYVNDIGASVRTAGKTPIVWEFYRNRLGRNVQLPKGTIIMAWEGDSLGATPMLDHGYSVINVPWAPGYRDKPLDHFRSNPYNVNGSLVKPGESLLGLQLNVWESVPAQEWGPLRASLPARMETVWQYPPATSYADFQKRYVSSDRVFGLLAGLR